MSVRSISGCSTNSRGHLAAEPALRNHAVIQALSDGFVVTILSIAQRAGLVESWPPPSDAIETEFRRRARTLEGSLAR